MATERAGGLSTTAIERCIDNWETETQDGAEIPAARAELAALTGLVAELTAQNAALREALVAALTEARAYLGSIDGRELVGAGRALRLDARALLRRLDAALAAAGQGAAGARDAAADLAAENARLRAALAPGGAADAE